MKKDETKKKKEHGKLQSFECCPILKKYVSLADEEEEVDRLGDSIDGIDLRYTENSPMEDFLRMTKITKV